MLVILVGTLAGAILLGVALHGRIRRLSDLRFRWLPLAYSALLLGTAPLFFELSATAARMLIVAGYSLIAIFLARNLGIASGPARVGLGLLLLGWLLNLIPVATNGGMPLSLHAYSAAGLRETPTPREGGFFKIVVADQNTRFNWLGDNIPIPPIQQVVSVGDLILMLGIGWVVVAGMTSKLEPSRRR